MQLPKPLATYTSLWVEHSALPSILIVVSASILALTLERTQNVKPFCHSLLGEEAIGLVMPQLLKNLELADGQPGREVTHIRAHRFPSLNPESCFTQL